MTLIIALACKQGLVFAADSQATESAPGLSTRFPVEKIRPLGSSILWASSGDVGLFQQVDEAFARQTSPPWQQGIAELRTKLRYITVGVVKRSLDNSLPIPTTQQWHQGAILFCGYTGSTQKTHWLLELLTDGRNTRYEERGFHAIGSGTVFAQVAQAMLAHYDIKNRTLDEGIKIAYRVMDSAIEVAAAYIGPPIRIWTISEGDVHNLTDDELQAVRDSVGLWKQLERETLQRTASSGSGA
ncbi:MAG: hypothetical protein Q7K03_03280 [Dehalococcoidia bacterium]|nr:hypothetical protein [Dehalococcoidia bacterium]